ncbi:kelch-like protein 24 isoform X1 [Biomphalaria glabrata]|uniref:Kelch-like protein 24 isoform X1 n=2 Tax=Biomphalaria glabrata TaxID=6526 RepID=A0A9W3BMX5_BIOGL|nr:kelch-like protein 24 isoform X1 [Biomphalaria glabrata]XP_055900776.1 kelch-like protein 24 isoform X1 [Biomphalaria glabrata]
MTWAQIAAQTLLQGLNGRLKSGQFCDVMIYVDDVEFPCHRVILCAYSDYFQAMFSSGMQEAITQSVKLNDVSHQTFASILEAIYNGKDILDERNVIEVWRVASMLQIACLRQYCEDFLADHISNENCLTIWREARLSSCKVLANEAWNFVHREFPSIKSTEDFLACDIDDICLMVASEDLNVPNEEEVIDAILLWVGHEESRRKQLSRLIALSRLCLVSEDFILRRLLTEQMILENQEVLEMVRRSLEYHILLSRRHDECPPSAMYRRASLYDNVMIVLGEGKDNFYAYVFKTEEWFQLPALPEDMGLGSSACSYGDDIFVAGGKNTMNALFQFETRKNSWVKLAPMNVGRRNHVIVAVGPCLYVLGGLNNEVTTLNSVECYDTIKAVWTDVGFLHTAVRSSGSAVIGKKVIICGGKENDTVTSKTVQCFNTATNTSYILGEMPSETCLPRTIIDMDKIYLITQEGCVWKMKLNDRSSSIHHKSQLWDFARYWHGALLHDGIVYIIAGETPDNSDLPDVWPIELQGVFQSVRNLRPANITRCMACIRTTMEKYMLKDSLAMDISRV